MQLISALFIIGFLLYSVSIKGSFVFDDIRWIVNNPAVHNIGNIAAIWQSNPTRFIANLTFAATYSLIGAAPFLYHLTNILIHIAAAFLVYKLIIVLDSKQKMLATSVAFLFLAHPIQTESVTYIIQRMTSLAALFYLLSLIFYIRWAKTGRKKWIYFAICISTAIIGYLTKEYAYSLPFAYLLIEYIFGKSFPGRLQKMPLVVIFIITIFVYISSRTLIFSHFSWGIQQTLFAPDASQHTGMTRYTYALTQLHVIPSYLLLLLLPSNQNIDYDFPGTTALNASTILSALLLFALLIFGVYMHKRNKFLSFGILFFFLTIVLESSIFPIADLMVEHRLYLPSIGFLITLVSLIRYIKIQHIAVILITILFAGYCGATYTRNRIWKSGEALWTDTVQKSPHKMRPHFNLAQYLELDGKNTEAITHYREALAINPGIVPAYVNLAAIYEKRGNFSEAKNLYQQALKVNPEEPVVKFRLSLIEKVLSTH
jgi:hypothetical protein